MKVRLRLAQLIHFWVVLSFTVLKMTFWLMVICVAFLSVFTGAIAGSMNSTGRSRGRC